MNVVLTGPLKWNAPPDIVIVPMTAVGFDMLFVKSVVDGDPPMGVTTSCPARAVSVAFAVNAPPAPTVVLGDVAESTRLFTSTVTSGGTSGHSGLLILPCSEPLVCTLPPENASVANGCAP